MPRRTWVDGRVDVLLAELALHGMAVSRSSVAELITGRVHTMANQMQSTEATARRYLDDNAVRDLARTMVAAVAEEEPGADLLTVDRSTAMPLAAVGRCIAGLAEAAQLSGADAATPNQRGHQLMQLLSAFGQLIADCEEDVPPPQRRPVMIPPALAYRAARALDNAAERVREGNHPPHFDPPDTDALAAAFRRDAIRLRAHTEPGS